MLLILFTFNFAFSQSVTLENSLLWNVSGSDAKLPSYILVIYKEVCSDNFKIDQNIKMVIENVNQYVMPVNFGDSEQFYESAKTKNLTPSIDEMTKDEIFIFKSKLSELPDNFNRYEDESALNIFGLAAFKYFNICSDYEVREVPMEYMQLAINAKKETIGLETARQNNQLISSVYNTKKMLNFLQNFEKIKNHTQIAAKAYSLGDYNTSYKNLTSDLLLDNEERDILIKNRNVTWLAKIFDLLKNKSIMFALPLENLYGDKGLINLLKGQGYTVTPSK